MQKIAATRAGAWFLARTQYHLHRIVFKLSNDRTTMAGAMTGIPVVILANKGANSGLIRTPPLVYQRPGESRHPDSDRLQFWPGPQSSMVLQFAGESRSKLYTQNGLTQTYTAHEAQGGEYGRYWSYALDNYIGFPRYKV